MYMAQWQNDIEDDVKWNLRKSRVIPLFHQTNQQFLQHWKISYNILWMVLVQTLNDFTIPLDLIFIFSQKRFLNVLKEKVWTFIDWFLVIGVVFGSLFVFAVGCRLLNANNSTVKLFENAFGKFWINETTDDSQEFIRLCALRLFVENLETEFVNEFVQDIFIQSDKKWEVNVCQVNVQLWLVVLAVFQGNWHRV